MILNKVYILLKDIFNKRISMKTKYWSTKHKNNVKSDEPTRQTSLLTTITYCNKVILMAYRTRETELTRWTKHWSMTHENEFRVRWTLQDRLLHFTILSYCNYRLPFGYSIAKTDQKTKSKHCHINHDNEVNEANVI